MSIENHNQLLPLEHSHINREEKIGRKLYPFHVKDKFQKHTFLPQTVFDNLNASRLLCAFLWKKYPFHTFFLVTHVKHSLYLSSPPGKFANWIFYTLSGLKNKVNLLCASMSLSYAVRCSEKWQQIYFVYTSKQMSIIDSIPTVKLLSNCQRPLDDLSK